MGGWTCHQGQYGHLAGKPTCSTQTVTAAKTCQVRWGRPDSAFNSVSALELHGYEKARHRDDGHWLAKDKTRHPKCPG